MPTVLECNSSRKIDDELKWRDCSQGQQLGAVRIIQVKTDGGSQRYIQETQMTNSESTAGKGIKKKGELKDNPSF